VSAADVGRGFFVRASDCAAAQSVKNSAFLLLLRSVAFPAQSFQLPFKILQFRDSCSNVRDMLIKQAVSFFAIFVRKVPHTQQLPDLIQGHIQGAAVSDKG
jgi:hypothetical protein